MTETVTDYAGLLVPAGTRLVHIGPHKTGTTAIQAALYNARPALLAQGVRHVGPSRNPAAAVRAVTGQPAPASVDTPPPIRHWHDLVREHGRAAEPRTVVSSEFFSWATPEVIGRIAADLDATRLQVVVTLRPLGRILPSQWQQNVQAGMVLPFDAWLRGIFGDGPGIAPNPFWQLHRHDALIRRWTDVLGPERVTAVVVDEADPGMLLRTFEGLLGLTPGTLVADRDLANRSMTAAETEAVRAFNVAAAQVGVSRGVHAGAMRFGAATQMKLREPGPDEPRIAVPRWALDRAAVVAAEMVTGIEATGVRVVGDLGSLASPVEGGAVETGAGVTGIPPEIAAGLAVGILVAGGAVGGRKPATAGAGPAAVVPELAWVPTRRLASIVVRRGRASIARRLRAIARLG
ncbi:MAG: hypothetical protein WCK58_12385 [Chloroflexota bacterium]